MRTVVRVGLAVSLATALLAGPAMAGRGGGGGGGGGHGGDREPAGGAFMSSYPAPYSTGNQAYGPPRSVDFQRPQYPYPQPEALGQFNPPLPPGYYYYYPRR